MKTSQYFSLYRSRKSSACSCSCATTQNAQSQGGVSQEIVLGALAILFALLALGLFLVNKTLRRFATANNVEIAEAVQRKSLWKAFVNNQFLMLVVAIFFLIVECLFCIWLLHASWC